MVWGTGEGLGGGLGYGLLPFLRELLGFLSVVGMSVATDEQLLADYARGESRALEELIRRYQEELYAFLYRFVGNAATAEDLFQETFVQVHRNVKGFDGERRVRPWLFTIAANKARDYLRSVGRHRTESFDRMTGGEDGGTFLDLMASGMEPPVVELERGEDVAAVRGVLAAMPAMYREVLVLSYFHGFAYKEMSEMLGVPLGTVKSRLHSALAVFAKAFKGRDGGMT